MMGAARPIPTPAPTMRVSAESFYGDPQWQMTRRIVGAIDTNFRINWDFELPDGTRFGDACWRNLRESSKLFIWSLHADPPPGRAAMNVRTLARAAYVLRRIIQWMVAVGLSQWRELDSLAVQQFFADMRLRPGVKGEALSIASVRPYLGVIKTFYHQRSRLRDAPQECPPKIEYLGPWAPERRWPYTPDDIAVPLILSALHMIEESADRIIAMRDHAQHIADAGIGTGVQRARVNRYLRSQPPVQMLRLPALPLATPSIRALNDRVLRLYDACFIVIAYLVGARGSEILALESGSIEWTGSDGPDGAGSYAYLTGTIRKGAPGSEGVPHRWVAPEPVVRAITVLERLSAPWREVRGDKRLWTTQLTSCAAIRISGLPLGIVGVTTISQRLNGNFVPFINLPHHDGQPWQLSSHQGRKTFARFVGSRDRTALFALRKHLGHVTRAMTDRAYVGTDFELSELVDRQAAAETRSALEDLLTAPRLAGKAGRILSERSPFRGRAKSGDLEAHINQILADTNLRLGVCDWGYCLYRRETSACLGSEREPNPALRTQSVCLGCTNFAITDKHRPVWEGRLRRNLELLDRPDLDPESRAMADQRVDECRRLLASMDGDRNDAGSW